MIRSRRHVTTDEYLIAAIHSALGRVNVAQNSPMDFQNIVYFDSADSKGKKSIKTLGKREKISRLSFLLLYLLTRVAFMYFSAASKPKISLCSAKLFPPTAILVSTMERVCDNVIVLPSIPTVW